MDKIALANRFEGFSKIFAEDTSIGVDLKAMSEALKKMSNEKFASIIADGYQEDSTILAPGSTPGTPCQQLKKPGDPKKVSPYGEFDQPKPQPVMASTDNWTKEAFDHVAENLVRDVLGMNKSQCEDTGRHQTKEQMPDAEKAPQLKNVRDHEGDTGRALTPEQVPNKAAVLNSDMYKKSKGPVKKEAAEEDEKQKGSEEPQDIGQKDERDAGKKPTEETVEELKKDKEKKEKAERLEKAKEKSHPATKDAEVETVDATIEGISFETAPEEVDANDPEIKKLSALFEMKDLK